MSHITFLWINVVLQRSFTLRLCWNASCYEIRLGNLVNHGHGVPHGEKQLKRVSSSIAPVNITTVIGDAPQGVPSN